MIEGFDRIDGARLHNICLSTWFNDSGFPEVTMVVFDFETDKLILRIDADTDQIITGIVKEMPASNPEYEMVEIISLEEHFLQEAIGKKILWLWEFENNQGYHDGIQIEFEKRFTIQFMVEASTFSLRTIKKMKFPSVRNKQTPNG